MKRIAALSTLFVILASTLAAASQTLGTPNSPVIAQFGSDGGVGQPASAAKLKKSEIPFEPFSQLALGGGISLMGVNLQAATNVNRYLNLRGYGNVLNYSINNISTNGFEVSGKLNMATAGVSLDYYPFPTHGLRLSPGLLFYNQNRVSATVVAAGGTSFNLNDVKYYSAAGNPAEGVASVGFNAKNPAFTITTGWGNMISRNGGHWSFPFELGAALVGSPSVNMALKQGQVCNSSGQNCVNVVGNTTLMNNVQAQIAKYKSDLDVLSVYPVFSFGAAYSFHIR